MSLNYDNIYGFYHKYRCFTASYLLSIWAHSYDIVSDTVIGAPNNGKYLVGGLNDIVKVICTTCVTLDT